MTTNIDTDLRYNNGLTLSLSVLEDWALGKATFALADAAWDLISGSTHSEAFERACHIVADTLLGANTFIDKYGETVVSRDCALMIDFTRAGFPIVEECDRATLEYLAELDTCDVSAYLIEDDCAAAVELMIDAADRRDVT